MHHMIPSNRIARRVSYFDTRPREPRILSGVQPAGISTETTSHGLIARLPPEILVGIFQHLALNLYNDECWTLPNGHTHEAPGRVEPIYSWIRITQVCKQWRTVALDNSSLWTNILANYATGSQVMLLHSQTANLAVRCLTSLELSGATYRVIDLPLALTQILTNIERIDTLELSILSARNLDRSPLFAAKNLPSLRSLSIHGLNVYDSRLPCAKWTMPRLEHLDIRAPLAGLWFPLFSKSLKHLSLQSLDPIYRSPGLPPMPLETLPLFQVLSRLPGLESLELRLDRFTGNLHTPSHKKSSTASPFPVLQL
ncbi:hypothetical protein BDW22DRAFT_618341 [Trametopsis cervina]|nr:hypothetical protein BDW22DRAFT_618341 [Trametopsis cervina]